MAELTLLIVASACSFMAATMAGFATWQNEKDRRRMSRRLKEFCG